MERIRSINLETDLIGAVADILVTELLPQVSEPGKVAVVFSGRRPALFLRQELARRFHSPTFPPSCLTLNEFINRVAGSAQEPISDLDAAYLIHQLIGKSYPSIARGKKSLADFLSWAEEILLFFDELDLENVPAQKLEAISAGATIGFDTQISVNLLLKHLNELRQKFHWRLAEQNKATNGLRHLAALKNATEFNDFETILFAAPFYLHQSEKELIRTLVEREKAVILFQGSEKEWPILRENGKFFNGRIDPPAGSTKGPQLQILAGFDRQSQAALARQSVGSAAGLETVIALPDEESLIPLLSELSPLLQECNVSMGYPLRRSAVFSLFRALADCQEERRGERYYTRSYLALLSHPLAKNLPLFADPAANRVLVHRLEELTRSTIFVTLAGNEALPELAESTEELKKLHDLLCRGWEELTTFSAFARQLKSLAAALLESRYLESYPFNLLITEELSRLADELAALAFADEEFPPLELFRIFLEKLGRKKLSFAGSPLRGLQVLGMLETRGLNFERVIILNCNEKHLPALHSNELLIPGEVKAALGLATQDREEEIQRYHFRRLLSGAKQAVLIYKDNGKDEKSRFLEELIWQQQLAAKNLQAGQPEKRSYPAPQTALDSAPAGKSKAIVEHLERLTYSATSLNTYLHCPLRFYFRYVLGLKEPEQFSDDPEASEIGTFIHEVLEESYRPLLNRPVKLNQTFTKRLFKVFDQHFAAFAMKRLKDDAFLFEAVARYRLESWLEIEKQRPVEELLGLEKKFSGELLVGDKKLACEARIDRLERLAGGEIWVLDYKTGSSDQLPSKRWEKLKAAELTRKVIKAAVRSFQLPLYLQLVKETLGPGRYNAGLYLLREPNLKMLFEEESEAEREELLQFYLNALKVLLGEILDPKIDFAADRSDQHYCEYCPYQGMCR